MKIKIVVARYNENIDWTKKFDNLIIYNKGNILANNFNCINLQNVGREGHTYYKYIYDNYDNLDDYTIFLQGNPFDHSPNLFKIIEKYLNNNLDIGIEFISERILYTNIDKCAYHENLPLKSVYNKLFSEKINHPILEFGAGAQFIVNKKNILLNPKEFYLKIINLLEYSINPIEGYVIERFHKLILHGM
jgi:hypothetical protein